MNSLYQSSNEINNGNNIHTSNVVNNYIPIEDEVSMATSTTYPHSKEFDFYTTLERIHFGKECEKDLAEGKGFVVEPSGRNIKKDLKAENGIFSPRFGQTLADVNPFIDRYKCRCKEDEPKKLRGRINAGLRCPTCGHLCEYVDDDFSYFGWMVLEDPYYIMHPSFYKKVESFFGVGVPIQGKKRTKLENILDNSQENNTQLTGKAIEEKLKKEPFIGIGMMEFMNRFEEIMTFYSKLFSYTKRDAYNDIWENIDIGFTQHIPVITTLLRPFDIRDGSMSYEPTNGYYSMMNKLVTQINKNKSKMQRNPKIKNQQLYRLQSEYMKLYNEQEEILSGKKGDFRCLLGGRYTFSSRNVIIQNPDLRIDEVTLPIVGLTILLEQRIKNILCRMYNMKPNDAHDIWYKATIEPNDTISTIIQSIIDDCKSKGLKGLPIIINRNPTISYGSILQMFCIGFTYDYTMAVPLQPLPLLAADFDGKQHCRIL